MVSTLEEERQIKKNLGCEIKKLKSIDGILCREDKEKDNFTGEEEIVTRRVVPERIINKVIEQMHDDPARAHPGRDETLRQIRKKFFFKKMYSRVEAYIKSCTTCNNYKGNTDKNVPLGSFPVASSPFERVSIDLITSLSTTDRGNKAVLVCIDQLTRYVEIVPLKDKSAKECALALFDRIICRYTAPEVILSDNGCEFRNSLMNELCETFKIKKVHILPYHPSSNGLVERANRKILDVMRHTIGQDNEWDLRMPMIQLSLNTRVHASTKETPIKCLMGYEPRMPYEWLNKPRGVVYNEDPVKIRLSNFKFIHKQLSKNLEQAQLEMVDRYNEGLKPVRYKIGDTVFVKNPTRSGKNYKLAKKFLGPYKVLEDCETKLKIVSQDNIENYVSKDRVKRVETVTVDNATEDKQDNLLKKKKSVKFDNKIKKRYFLRK